MRTLIAATLFAFCHVPFAAADDSPFVSEEVLKPELALEMAEAAMTTCRDQGYQVGVTVVDRSGIPQVFLRDRFAGLHVYETSRRKAWTAVSFRTSTSELAVATEPGKPSAGIRQLSEALPLGGGLVVYQGNGSIVGGIGVSGAPGPDLDDVCAQAGIDAIADRIAF
ncbi:MAG: GlcG/HbpS family heme-binding protein [Heliomarina sp.]|uniref:GlcG/HbpS family heme-binding protein n=1 Tax=Heliomarina sp. TaxID=2917556 RepID=UPI004059FB36